MRRKREKKFKPRNYVAVIMALNCKPRDHGDAKKEHARKECRIFKKERHQDD